MRNHPVTSHVLRLCAPYFAVGVFWCVLSNAWLSILAYHLQIIFWAWRRPQGIHLPSRRRALLAALPMIIAGPLAYFLIPHVTHTELGSWLASHHLSRLSFALLIPYFGILHPVLEQLHWSPLRRATPVAHLLFAGYHMLVLYTLLTPPWLVLCFVGLAVVSFAWQKLEQHWHCLAVPCVAHIAADLGIIIAAWLRMGGPE